MLSCQLTSDEIVDYLETIQGQPKLGLNADIPNVKVRDLLLLARHPKAHMTRLEHAEPLNWA